MAVLRVFKLLPPTSYQWLRRTPIINWLGRRILDLSLQEGFRLTPVLGGRLAGMNLELDRRVHKEMVVGHYEPVVQACIERCLSEGIIAFDVGAHVGYVSLLMASMVGAGGLIVAFEADPAIAACLDRNLDRNADRVAATVRAVPVALGAVSGTASFKRGDDTSTGYLTDGSGDIAVNVTTLDEVAASFGVPRLVKIDVEGAELDVLHGAEQLLRRRETTFVIETHSPQLQRSCAALLKDYGWTCNILDEPGTNIHLVAVPANPKLLTGPEDR